MTERERLILIARAKQKQQAEAAAAQTNLVEQVGTGTSEGIANMAGMPVDLLTKGINKVGGYAGMPPIETPVGGSESIKGLLDPFMSDVEPQTAGQRIGRRVGQDVGAGAVAAPLAGIGSLGGLGLNTASDVASGLVGGLTSLVTDNPTANYVASLLAGMAVPAGAYARRPYDAPSIDDLKAQETRLYGQVENSDIRLSPDQTQELQGNVSARMFNEGMYPPQHVGARGAVERVYELPYRHPEGTPSLHDVEDVRQYINQKVVPSDVAGEKQLGTAMKREIDAYVKGLPEQNPDAADDVAAYLAAHETSRKRMNAEEIQREFQSAGWRAASTGTGGNDINAARQNIRKILDNPERRAGYAPEEIAQMQKIVEGTKASNTARFLGSFAPLRGAAPGAFSFGQALLTHSTGNPLYLAPSAIGVVAQALGEHLTRKQVSELSAMVRSGKPLNRALTESEKAVLTALVASQAAQHTPQ